MATAKKLNVECRVVRRAEAPKVGRRAVGSVRYELVTLPDSGAGLRITGNDGRGHYSSEVVLLETIRACLSSLEGREMLPSKVLQGCFISRSVNNPGFLACALRNEGVFLRAPSCPTKHVLADGWADLIGRLAEEGGGRKKKGNKGRVGDDPYT